MPSAVRNESAAFTGYANPSDQTVVPDLVPPAVIGSETTEKDAIVDSGAPTPGAVADQAKRRPILLICDMQERFRAGLAHFDHAATITSKMLSAASILNLRVIVSEQRPDIFGSTVPEVGLANVPSELVLGTFAKTKFGMLIPEIAEILRNETHSGQFDGSRKIGRTPIVLMGIESHICVQQTALELAALGYDITVLADGVSSINHRAEVPIALDRMRQGGVNVSTSEAVLFTFMGDASRPEFRAFTRLIKDAKPATSAALDALFGGA